MTAMRNRARVLPLFAPVALLAGCFGSDDPKPLPEPPVDWISESVVDRDSTVVTDGDAVFVDDGKSLRRFDDTTGALDWSVPADGVEWQYWAGDGLVAAWADGPGTGLLVGHDPDTGQERFRYLPDEPARIRGVAPTDAAIVVVLDEDGTHNTTLALDPADGTELWHDENRPEADIGLAHTPVTAPDPVTDHDWQRAPSTRTLRPVTDTEVVLLTDSDDGESTTTLIDAGTGDPIGTLAAPVNPQAATTVVQELTDGRILTVDGTEQSCEDTRFAVTGPNGASAELTTRQLPPPGNSCAILNRFSVQDDLLLGQDESGRPQLLSFTTESPAWTAEEAGRPLLYRDGVAVYRAETDTGMWATAVDTTTGKKLWSGATTDTAPLNPEFVDDTGIIEPVGDDIVCHDLRDGRPLWRAVGSLLAVTTDHYLVSNGDKLRALDRRT